METVSSILSKSARPQAWLVQLGGEEVGFQLDVRLGFKSSGLKKKKKKGWGSV